eukprot:9472272-Pyramimonas_sp.AAC.1
MGMLRPQYLSASSNGAWKTLAHSNYAADAKAPHPASIESAAAVDVAGSPRRSSRGSCAHPNGK